MPSAKFALGIDFGADSGRVMLVDAATGDEVAWSAVRYVSGVLDRRLPDDTPLPHDWALQDPRDYLFVLEHGVPEVLAAAGADPNDILGIGIDFPSCTLLPTLADGTPLCLVDRWASHPHAWVKFWKHHAAQPQATRLVEVATRRREPFLAIYSGQYSSEWFFSKVLQIVEEAPEVYAAAGRLIEAGDWIVWQLTGREARSECAAGFKACWIKGQGYPSRAFFHELHPLLENVVGEKLSAPLLPLGASAGGLTPTMADRLGLNPGTPVAAAVADAHAAVPACGVTAPGRLVMILGASLTHLALGREARFVEGMCGMVQDGAFPGYWGYEATQASLGDLYAWFFRTGLPAELEREASRRGLTPAEFITTEAWRLKPGESGLLALDWWNGNRSILMDADLSGVLVGFTLSTRPEEIYRALVEATAFGARAILEAFDAQGLATRDIVACGDIAEKSPVVLQIFADVTGRPIRLPRCFQASGLGAALHATVAAGYYQDLTAAVSRMTGLLERAYLPNPAAQAVYNRLYTDYRLLHDYFGRGGSDVLKRLRTFRHDAGHV